MGLLVGSAGWKMWVSSLALTSFSVFSFSLFSVCRFILSRLEVGVAENVGIDVGSRELKKDLTVLPSDDQI